MNITLNNGVKMPLLGFGTYLLREGSQCEQSVLHALHSGYRLIDTAAAYGNEESVGKAIKKSSVKREEIFVTTKFLPADTGYEKAKRAFETSLKNLGLDYIDLYLIHLPQGDIHSSWTAMEELYKEGKVRAIGVSNFTMNQIQSLLTQHSVIPAVNQVETHPFSQKTEMQKALKSQGVQLESWAPFAQGKNNLFRNELLKALSSKYNKSIAQVVLRWLIQREVVAIPKSATRERIIENFNVFDFELSSEDMTAIQSLDKGSGLIYSV
ncbi:aldo/keto reductase [Cytophagaceae bacterium DM2B3-1]|uniref:Aldo/keto reductase n=1 Tax=Xanthocytophaga flava TaxID=3048013 RepID=A0ABT7CCZ2_9BACT|nr:aldo/keto reductase [Xanthocytophaga flavus]MDJ1470608.1 aldo/keto reductase [Xanthocytophaga flavus]MDJ1491549.1 aldo/keto reductase [Xanthocytophaga flavus]